MKYLSPDKDFKISFSYGELEGSLGEVRYCLKERRETGKADQLQISSLCVMVHFNSQPYWIKKYLVD